MRRNSQHWRWPWWTARSWPVPRAKRRCTTAVPYARCSTPTCAASWRADQRDRLLDTQAGDGTGDDELLDLAGALEDRVDLHTVMQSPCRLRYKAPNKVFVTREGHLAEWKDHPRLTESHIPKTAELSSLATREPQ